MGGHVGNDTVLSYMHEARMQYLAAKGFSEMNMEGVSIIMSGVAIEYKAEIMYGNLVTVYVVATGFSRAGFEVYYKLVNDKEKIVALAKTGIVCFDYKTKKVVSLPEAVKEKLSR